MMKNRMRRSGVILLAAALVLSVFALPKTYAAVRVETERSCSIQVNAPAEGFSELKKLPVEVLFYKVADIDVTGAYEATGVFEGKISFDDLSSDKDVVAAVWKEKAQSAKALVTKETEVDAKITFTEGTATATGLETGLYLVDAQPINSPTYKYDFQPYLISLPNNYYYDSELQDPLDKDKWEYDLTGRLAVGLKPEKTDRYGNLIIEKTLDTYNATNGGATFVFQVEAFKKDVDTVYAEGDKGKCVYSNVVSMTFKAPGKDSIKIEDIPAGAVVTVTEIYTGANYELKSEADQTTTIIADDSVAVSFENTHNREVNGGNGVVNSFIYDETNKKWTHSATEDSTP